MDKGKLKEIFWFESNTLKTIGSLLLFLFSWLIMGALFVSCVVWIVLAFSLPNFWLLILVPIDFYLGLLMFKATGWFAANLVFRG